MQLVIRLLLGGRSLICLPLTDSFVHKAFRAIFPYSLSNINNHGLKKEHQQLLFHGELSLCPVKLDKKPKAIN